MFNQKEYEKILALAVEDELQITESEFWKILWVKVYYFRQKRRFLEGEDIE